ncbi:folate-binding protein [Altererythrobacter sp. CC-YST694]|uniref:CAF17-like 4Fe-4S cluster assembly/insertion protein YgfZ n=1 Tax=Altererythrobacter sp. CC-YST694 TaxID=2755038 RepID=UPI001D00D64B|nr:folate-binding protein [Altererythrobacter sp. CC-YST694]MCB5424021.1 folate-binding protein [Altererythrobacter sp. CC-YST694]
MAKTRLFSRALVRLTPLEEGEDVRGFLQGLVTNDVTGLLPVWAGLLSAQGKTLFEFHVWPDGKGLLLDCESEAADELVKRLSLYRLRRRIAIERDDKHGIHWEPEPGDGGARDPRMLALGQRWIAPVSPDDESADEAWLKHRLSLGVPEGRAELGDILWLETNAADLNGVSFSKGCYVGQENTARMNWRQKVNRRLVVVPLDRSDESRRRIAYPELGLAVDHLRVDNIDPALLPAWQRHAIEAGREAEEN